MRSGDHMERFVVLPFSIGCASQSSVAVATSTHQDHSKKPKPVLHAPTKRQEGEERSPKAGKMKNNTTTFGFMALPKPNISSTGMVHKLRRGIKSLSHVFVVYEEEMNDEEMEIGHPTDVKHVTHIGVDGSSNANMMKAGWESCLIAPDIFSFPSISLRQFELAMAAQSHVPNTAPSNLA